MPHRSSSFVALLTLLAAVAALCAGCAISPARVHGGAEREPRDRSRDEANNDGLAMQTSSPRQVVDEHVARIEALRAQLGGSVADVEADDGESVEAQRDETLARQTDAQPPAPSPNAGLTSLDACENTCLLAQEICSSSTTICDVAEGSTPTTQRDLELVETCRWASATCDESLEVCVACRTPVVRGE